MLTIYAIVPDIDLTSCDFTTECTAVIITAEHIYKLKCKVSNEQLKHEAKNI